jgi:hypothetical protein
MLHLSHKTQEQAFEPNELKSDGEIDTVHATSARRCGLI